MSDPTWAVLAQQGRPDLSERHIMAATSFERECVTEDGERMLEAYYDASTPEVPTPGNDDDARQAWREITLPETWSEEECAHPRFIGNCDVCYPINYGSFADDATRTH